MSRMLVRRAIELVQNEIKSEDKIKKKKPAEALSKKYGIRKPKTTTKFPQLKKNDFSFVMKMKLPIGESKEKSKMDRTEENLQVLLQSKCLKPKSESVQKVLDYQERQLRKRVIEEPKMEDPEPESILFPEENKRKKKKRGMSP